jgi:hypothetical protein
MFHELLIKFGLIEPNERDIIDKLMRKTFTSKQLRDLSKVGPIIVEFPGNSDVIKEFKFDYINNTYEIGFLYKAQLFHKSLDDYSIASIAYSSTGTMYFLPTYDMLIKYLPEIRIAIEEAKKQLSIKIAEYRESQTRINRLEQIKKISMKKLWETIDNE